MPTALVTGASRGIGKAIAVHLARAGYDIAITARTVQEGESREHSSTLAKSDTSPLPGSLTSTAQLVEAEGVRSLTVPADLTDRASVIAAAKTVLAEWGPIDVLVNNGRYIGPGHMDRFIDTPLELLDRHLEANVMAPRAHPRVSARNARAWLGDHREHIVRRWYPRSDGPGRQWRVGIGYGFSKGALHRIAGILWLELGGARHPALQRATRIYRHRTHGPGHGWVRFQFDTASGPPPDAVGAAVSWIVRNPDAADARLASEAREVEAQQLCGDLGLLPDWPTPDNPAMYGR